MGRPDSSDSSSTSPDVTLSFDAAARRGGDGADTSSLRDQEKMGAKDVAEAAGVQEHDSSSDSDDSDATEHGLGRTHTAVSLGAVPGSVAAGIEAGQPPDCTTTIMTTTMTNDDPERLNRVASGPVYTVFSKRTKMYIISVVTMTTFISPMTANVYFPALPVLAQDMGVSLGMISLTLTTFMIFQGIAPSLFGNFGDMAGRRPAVILAMVIYLFVNIGLALQSSFAALLVLRMFQSFGSSGTLALGYAVVSDVSVSAERGKYMSLVNIGVNVAPGLSPVIGGILAQYLGWRAIFWFCCIYSGVVLVPYALTVPETSRNVVGNGSVPPPPLNRTVLDLVRRWRRRRHQRRQRRHHPLPEGDGALAHTATAETTASTATSAVAPPRRLHFPNPLRTLYILFEKDMALALLSSATTYVVSSVFVSTMSSIFEELYALNELQVGLCFLPYGAGCLVASIAQGYLLDWNYRRTAQRIGFAIDYKRGDDLSHFPIERARIEVLVPMVVAGVAVVIGYGWALQYAAPLAVSLVLAFFVGLTVVGAFSLLNTLIMDLYPQAPATAVAANNMVRCLLGAGVMAFIQSMFDSRLGYGWTFTFWALMMALLLPILWVLGKWGPAWREERRLRMEAKAAQHRAQEEEKKRRRDDAQAA